MPGACYKGADVRLLRTAVQRSWFYEFSAIQVKASWANSDHHKADGKNEESQKSQSCPLKIKCTKYIRTKYIGIIQVVTLGVAGLLEWSQLGLPLVALVGATIQCPKYYNFIAISCCLTLNHAETPLFHIY